MVPSLGKAAPVDARDDDAEIERPASRREDLMRAGTSECVVALDGSKHPVYVLCVIPIQRIKRNGFDRRVPTCSKNHGRDLKTCLRA